MILREQCVEVSHAKRTPEEIRMAVSDVSMFGAIDLERIPAEITSWESLG